MTTTTAPRQPRVTKVYGTVRPAATGAAVPAAKRGRFTRSLQVRTAMVITGLAIVFFAVSVHLAVSDAQKAVTTVGQDDTAGISAAQRVKSDLAEMDLLTTQELLRPSASKGNLPDAYVTKHKQLVADLDTAAEHITLGTAESVPLANLEYERAQYQSLVRDAILADQGGDRAKALSLEAQAHDVMTGPLGLQDQADAFDKANTYALNQSYDSHKASSKNSGALLNIAGWVLIAVLLLVQGWHVVGFRRVLNIGLAVTTVVAIGVFGFVTLQITGSEQHLTEAREHAFDPVHELWQARAAAYAARQAEAQTLLDPAHAGDTEKIFQQSAGRLYRLPDASANVADSARKFATPTGAGGYLVNELTNQTVSLDATAATKDTLTKFADYYAAHDLVKNAAANNKPDTAVGSFLSSDTASNGHTFTQLVSAIDKTLALNEAAFTTNAQAASDALNGIDVVNIAAAVVMLVLVMWGLSQRLREYSGT